MTDFTFYNLDNAQGEALDLLTDINGKYGFIPNLIGYMAEAPATIKAYLQLNNLLQETSFSNEELQTALLAVSVENKCDFCAAAHKYMGAKFKANPQTLEAIASGSEIEDEKDKVLVETVLAVVKERGWVSEDVLAKFFEAGFSKKHYLELQLIVTIKTLSNYINHLTQPEPNPEFLEG